MRSRLVVLVLLLAVIATACGAGSTDTTTAPIADSEQSQLAARLVELEPPPGEDWDRDSALDALTAARRLFVLGWDASPPINFTRLFTWVEDNHGAVTDGDWERIIEESDATALGMNAVLAADTDYEELQARYQIFADQAEDFFRRMTGHGLGFEIYLALSDLPALPGDFFAATGARSSTSTFRGFFSPERYEEFDADYEARIGDEPACVIVLGTTFFGLDADSQAGGLMHEVAHCHQQAIHPGGPPGFFLSLVPWMDEGYASWAGEAFADGSLKSDPWWDEYLTGIDMRFELYESSYRGIGFFSHLEASGVDVWGNFIDYFTDIRNNGGSESDRYASLAEPLTTEQIGAWAAGVARHPDWSPAWEAVGPGITLTARSPKTEILGAGDTVLLETSEAHQSLHAFDIRPPGDDSYLIAVAGRGAGRLRWGWGEESAIDDATEGVWCFGADCTCEDGTSPAPGATVAPIGAGETPQLDVALVGPPLRPAAFGARLETLEDVCEDPAVLAIVELPPAPPPATTIAPTTTTTTSTFTTTTTAPIPATTTTSPTASGECLIGTWVADPAELEAYILTLYRLIGGSPVFLGGEMIIGFLADGTLFTLLDGVAFAGTLPTGELAEALINGESSGTWEVNGDQLIAGIETTTVEVVVTIEGVVVPQPPITSGDGGERAVQFECSGNTLTIDPTFEQPVWPLPRNWERLS